MPRGKPTVANRRLGIHSTARMVEETEPKRKKKNGLRKAPRADFGVLDNNEVETPDYVLFEMCSEFGAMFDPCPFVGKGEVPDFDGLAPDYEWMRVNFVNPPYDKIAPWTTRAAEELEYDKTTIVFIPARTGSRYWQQTIYNKCSEIRFVTGKIVFKGYRLQSPHQLTFIIYKSASDKEAERCNSKWPIREQFEANPALASRYPVLYEIIRAICLDGIGFSKASPEVWAWMLECHSACRFLNLLAEGELSSLESTVLPVFAQLTRLLQDVGMLEAYAGPPEEQVFSLPELLRRLAYSFATVAASQLQMWSDSLLQTSPEAISFVEAFLRNAHMHWLIANRIPHERCSYDGQFQQRMFYNL